MLSLSRVCCITNKLKRLSCLFHWKNRIMWMQGNNVKFGLYTLGIRFCDLDYDIKWYTYSCIKFDNTYFEFFIFLKIPTIGTFRSSDRTKLVIVNLLSLTDDSVNSAFIQFRNTEPAGTRLNRKILWNRHCWVMVTCLSETANISCMDISFMQW